jgi:LysR family transcriptional regulator (chromosome initiation inhibitor)
MQMKQYFIVLDYSSLAAVAAVVREGSFEKAAQSLGITPSAVSQRVRGYEERLGVVLIVRGQPCTATGQGKELCAHFDKVRLLEADLTSLSIGETAHSARPSLRIAVNADSLATWFPHAMTAFSQNTGMLLELMLEDEAHTADRLRTGDVLAVVTSDPEPVQGCRTIALGALAYVGCASPAFVERHFAAGIDGQSLSEAPVMRFNRKDHLQSRWVKDVYGVDLNAPTHWIPSTQAFLDLALAGLAWGLQPRALAQPHIDAGSLVELASECPVMVSLFWTVSRLHAQALNVMTDAVRSSARRYLDVEPG